MRSEKLQSLFIRWLDTVLADEIWRAVITAKILERELPVINVGNMRAKHRHDRKRIRL